MKHFFTKLVFDYVNNFNIIQRFLYLKTKNFKIIQLLYINY